MTKQEVKSFRGDFQKAVAQLEAQYGVRISLGTIRFDENGLRAKMEAVKGDAVEVFDKDDFVVGETVKINHKKVDSNDQFRIVKINSKNVVVEKINVGDGRIAGTIRVSPSLLVKIEKKLTFDLVPQNFFRIFRYN